MRKTNSVLSAPHAYSIHYPVAKMQRHLTNGNQTWHQIHTLSLTIYATIAMKNEQQPTYIGQVVTLVTHVGSNYCPICLMSGPPKEKL